MISADVGGHWQQLQTLQPFVSELDQLRGELSLDVKVAGRAQEPQMNGGLELHKLHFLVAATGTEISDGDMQIQIAPNSLNMTATANLGEGDVDVSAKLLGPLFTQSNNADKTLDVRLKGRNMTLIQRPNLILKSDADLQLKGNSRALKLSGLLDVNNSVLTLEQLPNTATRVSPDQVVVGQEKEQQKLIPVNADLKIRLGEQVRLQWFWPRHPYQRQFKNHSKWRHSRQWCTRAIRWVLSTF